MHYDTVSRLLYNELRQSENVMDPVYGVDSVVDWWWEDNSDDDDDDEVTRHMLMNKPINIKKKNC